MNRRSFISRLGVASLGGAVSRAYLNAASKDGFRFRYMLASSMYGELPLDVILPEVQKTGASFVDIWPRVHGNQREQMDLLGHSVVADMLAKRGLQIGCLTRYDLGPFGLRPEMAVAKRFACRLMVCGGSGPAGLKGSDLKGAVQTFVEKMRPELEHAAEHEVSIAIENHGNNLIDSADSLKWLIDLRPLPNLKVALAPYHLERLDLDERGLADLIGALGNEIGVFYAWQYGMGCHKKLPKEQELLQMAGRGDFDFTAPVRALRRINYEGFTELFMHPVPRGIPILPTAGETTAEINRSRSYLEQLAVVD